MKSFFRTVFLVMMLLSVTNTFAQPTRSTQNRNRGNSMQQLGNSFRNALNQQKQQQRKSTTSSQSRSKNSKSTSSTNNDSSDPLEEEFNKGRSKSDSNRNNAKQAAVQKEKDDVTLVVSGAGKDKTEATKVALRSAIEQAYGVFVSANTDILNDELVKDEVATIASGNIKSYKELSSTNLPDGTVSVSLSAIVSTGKLVSYVQAHGGSAEFAGQTFMMEMNMEKLNQENERAAIRNLCDIFSKVCESFFDYSIEVMDAQAAQICNDDSMKKVVAEGYAIPVNVTVALNENFSTWKDFFLSTLDEIALNESQVQIQKSRNLKFYGYTIFNGEYYFRNNLKEMGVIRFIGESLNQMAQAWGIDINGVLRFFPAEILSEDVVIQCRKHVFKGGGYDSFISGCPKLVDAGYSILYPSPYKNKGSVIVANPSSTDCLNLYMMNGTMNGTRRAEWMMNDGDAAYCPTEMTMEFKLFFPGEEIRDVKSIVIRQLGAK